MYKRQPPYHGTSGTGTGPGGYPGAGPSDSRWQSGFLLGGTRSALTRCHHITPVFTFIFCLQRYPIMKIITRGEDVYKRQAQRIIEGQKTQYRRNAA